MRNISDDDDDDDDNEDKHNAAAAAILVQKVWRGDRIIHQKLLKNNMIRSST